MVSQKTAKSAIDPYIRAILEQIQAATDDILRLPHQLYMCPHARHWVYARYLKELFLELQVNGHQVEVLNSENGVELSVRIWSKEAADWVTFTFKNWPVEAQDTARQRERRPNTVYVCWDWGREELALIDVMVCALRDYRKPEWVDVLALPYLEQTGTVELPIAASKAAKVANAGIIASDNEDEPKIRRRPNIE